MDRRIRNRIGSHAVAIVVAGYRHAGVREMQRETLSLHRNCDPERRATAGGAATSRNGDRRPISPPAIRRISDSAD
jgi:hypothetical protein